MSFDPGDLELLDRTAEVEIETQSEDSTLHRTIIWVVVDADVPYIRSYRGPSARWYREARRTERVTLLADGHRIPARVVSAADPISIERVSRGIELKYATDPATPAMVRVEVLPTTLRLEPA